MKVGKSWILLVVAAILTILGAILFSLKGLIVMLFVLALVMLYYLYPSICCVKAGKKYKAGDNEGCLRYFEKAYKSRRVTPMVALTYAYQLIRMADTDKAELILNDLLNQREKLKPNELQMTKQNLSLVMYKTERFMEAKELMEDVFSEVQSSATYGTLGYYKILADGCADALSFCEKAFSFNNDDPVIADNLLTVYIGMDRFEDAKAIVEQVMKNDTKKILEFYYHAAQIEEKVGELAAAEHYITLAKEQKRSFLTAVSEEEIKALDEIILKRKQATEDQKKDSEN